MILLLFYNLIAVLASVIVMFLAFFLCEFEAFNDLGGKISEDLEAWLVTKWNFRNREIDFLMLPLMSATVPFILISCLLGCKEPWLPIKGSLFLILLSCFHTWGLYLILAIGAGKLARAMRDDR